MTDSDVPHPAATSLGVTGLRQVSASVMSMVWLFRADSTNNLGGNPALSTLSSRDLGTEVNLTVRYIHSRRTLLQGHIAATFAGRGVEDALGTSSARWLSAMLFTRVAF